MDATNSYLADFSYFESQYSCSPKGYPQNGHTLWLALLVPGLASLLLEFPPINYRYFWFVEIWQVWAFKNVSLMMLNLLCQLDVIQSHHGNTPLIFPDKLIISKKIHLRNEKHCPMNWIPRWNKKEMSWAPVFPYGGCCVTRNLTPGGCPLPTLKNITSKLGAQTNLFFPLFFSGILSQWREH